MSILQLEFGLVISCVYFLFKENRKFAGKYLKICFLWNTNPIWYEWVTNKLPTNLIQEWIADTSTIQHQHNNVSLLSMSSIWIYVNHRIILGIVASFDYQLKMTQRESRPNISILPTCAPVSCLSVCFVSLNNSLNSFIATPAPTSKV